MLVSKDKVPAHKTHNAIQDIQPPVHTHLFFQCASLLSDGWFILILCSTSFHLKFPSFGDSCETAEMLNFMEQCENFLEIRHLPSNKLIGTLSMVLKGPTQSWWKAEK